VTLARARQLRDDVRQSLRKGVDPVAVKEADKATKAAAAVKAVTLADAVDSYPNDHDAG
jgi:integrase